MKAASEHLESFIHSDYAKRKKKKNEKKKRWRGVMEKEGIWKQLISYNMLQ